MGSPTTASEAIVGGESGGLGRFDDFVEVSPCDPRAERDGAIVYRLGREIFIL